MTPDPLDVQALFGRHYFYFAALTTLGALQIAVSIGGFRGMWLLPGRLTTRYFGIALIIAGIALFFMLPLWVDGPWAAGSVEADSSTRLWGKADWGDLGAARNVNDVDGGLAGTGQATWFPLAALIAGILSVGAGTLNRRLFPGRMNPSGLEIAADADGMDLMVTGTFFSAISSSWQKFKRDLRKDAAALLEKSDRWSISVKIWNRWLK